MLKGHKAEVIGTELNGIGNCTVKDHRQGGFKTVIELLTEGVMLNINMGEAELSTRGVLVYGSRDMAVLAVSIDTRTLNPGDLFFAIRGIKNDGHQYIAEALNKGALGAVVDQQYTIPGSFPEGRILLKVADTHQALKDLAAQRRRRWSGSLVAITGSMGKTTTKEFAACVLQTQYSVYRSPGNYNNLFGLPLALFGLSAEDHIGIFEMGMSAPGEIAEMCRIASPDIGVITNVAPVHLEFFASVEEIAHAKEELAQNLSSGGTLIFNADDPLVQDIADRFTGHRICFGLSASADVRADEVEVVGLEETRFRLWCDGISQRAAIPLAGVHYLMNALPAIALGSHFHLHLQQMVENLKQLPQAPMRGQVLSFREGFTVIDDSYNSNPEALMRMIETFSQVPSYNRRILVAGEMLELGIDTNSLHYKCGSWAATCGVDVVVAVQGAAKEIAQAALAAGVPGSQVHFFSESNTASDFVACEVQKGDLVLIKGSRGVHMERIVRAVCARHAQHEE